MAASELNLHRPATPGLFVTGTDTGVGKTVVACLIADQLRRRSIDRSPRSRVGVLKPIATGCRKEREGLVSDDAEQLAFAADFDSDIGDLTVINPIRFRPPVAPAVALEALGPRAAMEFTEIDRSLRRLDEKCEAIVVEGAGGVLVPIDGRTRAEVVTMLDLIAAVGYPAVVVCRAGLGTLNHTALTVRALLEAGVSVAGLVVNGYDADARDESMESNRRWLTIQTGAPVLATLPRAAKAWDVKRIDPALRDAIDVTDFAGLCREGRAGRAPGRR